MTAVSCLDRIHDDSLSDDLLTRKMSRFVHLDQSDRLAIGRLTRVKRVMRARETLFREGQAPSGVTLILSGVAVRYRFLSDGRRQIFGYLLPGDLCDAHHVITGACDHNIALLCDSEVALIPIADLMTTMVAHPRIERALLQMVLVESAVLREWLLNVGQRDGYERLAHFLCEMSARLDALQATNADGSFSLPFTQHELADTMGMTVNHVNRILQRFRRENVLIWNRHQVKILNPEALKRVSEFSAKYLHLYDNPIKPKLAAYG